MALLNLVYRDQLFPHAAYAGAFDALLAALPDRKACRIMVGLLALAHERGCEAELAQTLDQDLAAGRLPDPGTLEARFAPDPACVPEVTVALTPLSDYDELGTVLVVGDAA